MNKSFRFEAFMFSHFTKLSAFFLGSLLSLIGMVFGAYIGHEVSFAGALLFPIVFGLWKDWFDWLHKPHARYTFWWVLVGAFPVWIAYTMGWRL